MTTHAMTGRGRRLKSHLSEVLARMTMNTPEGWTVCGALGLMAMVRPNRVTRGIQATLDTFLGRSHCEESMLRSIDRAKCARKRARIAEIEAVLKKTDWGTAHMLAREERRHLLNDIYHTEKRDAD